MRDHKREVRFDSLPRLTRAGASSAESVRRAVRLRLFCSKPKTSTYATGLTGRVRCGEVAGLIPAGAANSWPRSSVTEQPISKLTRALKHGRRLMSPV